MERSAPEGGLGLPDRDYYLKFDAKLKEVRTKYQAHVATMFGLMGGKDAANDPKGILALETKIAKAQWTNVENRDPVNAYLVVIWRETTAN